MQHREELCLSVILSDHENSCQVTRGGWQPHTAWHTILVPSATRHVDSTTSASSSGSQAFDQPNGGPPPAAWHVSNNQSQQEAYRTGLTNSFWHVGDQAQIKCTIQPGVNGVADVRRGKLIYFAPIREFLSDSFHNGLQYGTINTYRSALSNVLPPMEGFLVGQHPLVVRLMKGIQNSRPAMPRYQHCWDINQVLDYIKSLPANMDVSLDLVTGKLATLMPITAPKRSSELGLLDLNFSKKHPEGISFSLPDMTKTSSEVCTVFFASFPSANAICVSTTLDAYLNRTAQAREHLSSQTGVPNPLFLSYHRPYKPVKHCSIAWWIKKFVGSAGINTEIFKAHSTRSASTTKARNQGVSIADIQNMADWSRTRVKTHKLLQVCKQVLTSLFTSCQQVVFALLVPSLL